MAGGQRDHGGMIWATSNREKVPQSLVSRVLHLHCSQLQNRPGDPGAVWARLWIAAWASAGTCGLWSVPTATASHHASVLFLQAPQRALLLLFFLKSQQCALWILNTTHHPPRPCRRVSSGGGHSCLKLKEAPLLSVNMGGQCGHIRVTSLCPHVPQLQPPQVSWQRRL